MPGAVLKGISSFSFLRGVLSPETLCIQAKRLGYEAVALADRDNLCALPEFLSCCRTHDLRPVIAAEVTFMHKSVLLYADGDLGYANLCRVITQRHCLGIWKSFSKRQDARATGGDYFTGGASFQPARIFPARHENGFSLAEAILADQRGLLAVTEHVDLLLRLSGHMPAFFRMKNPTIPPKEVRECSIPCLILPESAFICPQDYRIHKLLRAIALNTTLSRVPQAELLPEDSYLRPWSDISHRFCAFPEYLRQTEEFILSVHSRKDFGALIFPQLQSDESALKTLRDKALAGARKRFPHLTRQIFERLNYELDLIAKKGFASYFLIVEDIVRQSPRTCGRGSGAASLVAYCLGITNVDPLRHKLMFERFLNPGRKDPPDLDIDFAWDERDQVLEYVLAKYGLEHVAMVATHLTFQPRSSVREVARVYGIPEAEIGKITKRIPWFCPEDEEGRAAEVLQSLPVPQDKTWTEIINFAGRMIGLPRGIATHCGGIIITPDKIYHTVPVQYSAKGFPIIQWEKDGAEEMGLVKIDLLGNRSLAVIRDTIASLKKEGTAFDETGWDPVSDPKTKELLAGGKSMGIFYVESPAMRLLQQKTGKGDFEHLIIHSSIIRPAANIYIKEYIRRLRGGAYKPLHPALEEILAETYGIMVYQEDVVRVVMALAGFDYEEANSLRKIITKKERRRRLEDWRKRFFIGASQHGADQPTIQKVWEMILSFSGYSFCKPHSASYAQVSFQAAFLKAHYPAAFMAAVLSNYGGFYTTQAYISEAKRLGFTILPPDANRSGRHFTHLTACNQTMPEQKTFSLKKDACVASEANSHPVNIFVDIVGQKRLFHRQDTCATGRAGFQSEKIFPANYNYIQVGLSQIKGLPIKAQEKILSAREKGGEFESFEDFLIRTHLEESEAEKLVPAGACDQLSPELNRPQLLWKMRCFYQNGDSSRLPVPKLKPYSTQQLLRLEYRALGFLTFSHPITLIFPHPAQGLVKAVDLEKRINQIIRIRGWLVTSKTVSTIKGDDMQFITFEDETGLFETVLFPDVYRIFSKMPGKDKAAFLITGKVVEEFGAITLEVKRME